MGQHFVPTINDGYNYFFFFLLVSVAGLRKNYKQAVLLPIIRPSPILVFYKHDPIMQLSSQKLKEAALIVIESTRSIRVDFISKSPSSALV
ncbi:MAG: hypothetical protein Q9194_007306 [Teloschistes cf. exilis]